MNLWYLVAHCGRKFWSHDLCLLVGISVLCLFLIMDTLHMHGGELLAVLDHSSLPEELIDVLMTLQNRLGFSACIL